MNAPQTFEGWQVWDLVQRLGGQIRVAAGGMGSGAVIGWDMGAALALAAALGVPGLAVAELLPAIEGAMVRKLSEQIEDQDG